MSSTIQPIPYTTHDRVIRDYVSRGLIVLCPESLGVPESIHQTIFDKECEALHARERIDAVRIPEILDILNSPGVVSACDQLLGKNWAIVPFTHNTPFMSGSNDQHWHKDDNGPYNSRKVRHHHAVQVELLYYPQDVRSDMGPTATVPYSQYWTFDHEENHDNFAGADHLDFGYQLSGMERIPVSGPKSEYAVEDIVKRRTAHDKRMRDAVLDLEWPLCQPFEVGPLEAGSVVLYSHNLLHRGNHRRDDWQTWRDNPRFMWRFWLYRTEEPRRSKKKTRVNWEDCDEDPLTKVSLKDIPEGVKTTWDYHFNWIQGIPNTDFTNLTPEQRDEMHKQIMVSDPLWALDDVSEHLRISEAYTLATLLDTEDSLDTLEVSLASNRESVRRAATFGLIACGERASDVLLQISQSESKWLQKAGLFGLGETGKLNDRVVNRLTGALLWSESVYIRSVAASALGSYGRRAIRAGVQDIVPIIAEDFVISLNTEVNRLSMDRAQNRNIKYVRPSDSSDICEGIGFDYGHERFKPVRSAVRENILWSAVILCSHGTDIFEDQLDDFVDALCRVIQTDENLFCVGSAMDALARLAWLTPEGKETPESLKIRKLIPAVFETSPIRCEDSLSRIQKLRPHLLETMRTSADGAATLPSYDVTR